MTKAACSQLVPLLLSFCAMGCGLHWQMIGQREFMLRSRPHHRVAREWNELPNWHERLDDAPGRDLRCTCEAGREVISACALATSTNAYVRSVLVSRVLYRIDDKRIQESTCPPTPRLGEDEDERATRSQFFAREVSPRPRCAQQHYPHSPRSSFSWQYRFALWPDQ